MMLTFIKLLCNKLVLISLLINFTVIKKVIAAAFNNGSAVSASVTPSCTIITTDMNYGNYMLDELNTTSTVTVICTTGTNLQIGLNGGGAANVVSRKMTSGDDSLSYELYQDAARTINWGNNFGEDTVTTSGIGRPQVFVVYGRVPAAQAAPDGTYSDSIITTISF